MLFVPYQPAHLATLQLQEAQAYLGRQLCDPKFHATLATGFAATALADGRPVACAGILPQWAGRGIAWAIIGREFPKSGWTAATRRALAVLEAAFRAGYRRIEAPVECDFAPGCRWAELMGFSREGRMRSYSPQGTDCWLFAKVSPVLSAASGRPTNPAGGVSEEET